MELERALPTQLEREALPWEAAFLAGKCFLAYRLGGRLLAHGPAAPVSRAALT
ncbi:MAG: hypothetical protein ACTHQQ_16315 [Solirubrobacteraceae bacterium]